MGKRLVYHVIAGSNKCPREVGPWCGWREANATPMVLHFLSDDLKSWKFQGIFWQGDHTFGRMVDCPDLFPLADGTGRMVFTFLDHGPLAATRPVWMIGYLDEEWRFTAEKDSFGLVDHGQLLVAQSVTDAKGRRVQLGWVNAPPGVMSVPRVIGPSPNGRRLLFHPLPELKTLHQHRWSLRSAPVGPGESLAIAVGDRFHMQANLSATMKCSETAKVVLDFAYNNRSVSTPVALLMQPHNLTVHAAAALDIALPMQSREADLKLDVFVDVSLVEIFVNDGFAVMSLALPAVPNEVNTSSNSFYLSSTCANVNLDAEIFTMRAAIIDESDADQGTTSI